MSRFRQREAAAAELRALRALAKPAVRSKASPHGVLDKEFSRLSVFCVAPRSRWARLQAIAEP